MVKRCYDDYVQVYRTGEFRRVSCVKATQRAVVNLQENGCSVLLAVRYAVRVACLLTHLAVGYFYSY